MEKEEEKKKDEEEDEEEKEEDSTCMIQERKERVSYQVHMYCMNEEIT